ncbi:globin [Paenibacillus sp. TRM 82003]|nr:globin [Paenibacillus sp. TRM 82003]
MTEASIYETLGGAPVVDALVEAFYPRVVKDPDLAPLFEGGDLDEVIRKQKLFLTQFLGGPQAYSAEFGHPMLRFRHLPFAITPRRAEAWLACMAAAMDDIGLAGGAREFLFGRLTQVAHHMVNAEEPQSN